MWLIALGLASALVGAMLATQPVINAELNRHVGSPLWAGVASISISWVFLGGLAATGVWGWPRLGRLVEAPPWVVVGGVVGAVFVVASLWLAPRIGAAAFFSWFVAGQLVAALLMDHFGLMNLPQEPISLVRLAGVALAIAGAILVKLG